MPSAEQAYLDTRHNRMTRVLALGADGKMRMKQTKHTSFTVLYHCKRAVKSTGSHLYGMLTPSASVMLSSVPTWPNWRSKPKRFWSTIGTA